MATTLSLEMGNASIAIPQKCPPELRDARVGPLQLNMTIRTELISLKPVQELGYLEGLPQVGLDTLFPRKPQVTIKLLE